MSCAKTTRTKAGLFGHFLRIATGCSPLHEVRRSGRPGSPHCRRHRVQQENLAAVGVCLQPFQRLCRFGLCIGFPVHIGIAPEQGAVAAFLCRLQRCLGVFPAGTPEILHFIAVIVQYILVQIQNLCLCLGFGQRGQAGVGHARGCPGRVPPQSCGSQGQFPFWHSRR